MNIELLKAIGAAQTSGVAFYVSADEGLPLVKNVPPLITVDGNKTDPANPAKIAATLTEDGARMIANGADQQAAAPASAAFAVATGFVAPKLKRGGGNHGGNPGKYPFDTLEVGQVFFVADSAVSKGDAFKTLSSAVGSTNQRYSEDVIENGVPKTKVVERTKRGADHKALKGPDGKNVRETVTVNEKKSTRKFIARKVVKGVKYGEYVAPDNGAVALRTE